MTIGGIHAFVSYLTFMMWPIQDLARVYAEMQHSIASAERIFKLVDTPPEVHNRPDAVEAKTLLGEIEFDHVDFFYEDRKPVLTDFTLKVKPGEMIALVGPTGGGKTHHRQSALPLLRTAANGVIRINGRGLHGLQAASRSTTRSASCCRPRTCSPGRCARTSATDGWTPPTRKWKKPRRSPGAHDFIVTLEKGYEQNVGEGGNLLSVGQKQLISLARAVLASPELFIMDEATSSVDTLTEALIQRGMEALMAGTHILRHRAPPEHHPPRRPHLVIEERQDRRDGTHAELLKLRGHYYRLYTQQFKFEKEQAYGVAVPNAVPVIK